MISLVIGLVLGALVGGAVVYAYQRQQTTKLREDRHLLAARLRSLVALMDRGLVDVRDPEVKQILLDTRAMLDDGTPLVATVDREQVDSVPRARPAERAQTDSVPLVRPADREQADGAVPLTEEDEEDLPSLFDRGSSTRLQK